MRVVHNGIDLGRVPPFALDRRAARAARSGSIPARRLVAQVGRLEPQKDYPTFLAAAARVAAALPDVDFLVVGEGALRAELEALAARLGLADRVRFLGLRHDVPALLGGVDVLALTSRYEGLPNVVIEAMATGAVAVATDVGGCRELIVPGETGLPGAARRRRRGGRRDARGPAIAGGGASRWPRRRGAASRASSRSRPWCAKTMAVYDTCLRDGAGRPRRGGGGVTACASPTSSRPTRRSPRSRSS